MHGILYVCLPRSEARSSLQARKKVCGFLTEEGFATQLRFSGHCDYFSVGGRWSGRLSLLRLRHEQPKPFARFWKRYTAGATGEAGEKLFRATFPGFRGRPPVDRKPPGFHGSTDDAQVM